jgi:hypothetical protein
MERLRRNQPLLCYRNDRYIELLKMIEDILGVGVMVVMIKAVVQHECKKQKDEDEPQDEVFCVSLSCRLVNVVDVLIFVWWW